MLTKSSITGNAASETQSRWIDAPIPRYQAADTDHNDVDEDIYVLLSYSSSALLRLTTTPFNFSVQRDDRIL
eukprot:scaffold4278_cov173-Amphora_coffeaeformis.AAC.17